MAFMALSDEPGRQATLHRWFSPDPAPHRAYNHDAHRQTQRGANEVPSDNEGLDVTVL